MDKELIEKHLQTIARLAQMGVHVIKEENKDEIFRAITQDFAYYPLGVHIPFYDAYVPDYKEAVVALLESALNDFKQNDDDKQIIPIFSGEIEFESSPYIKSLITGEIFPCCKHTLKGIDDFLVDLVKK